MRTDQHPALRVDRTRCTGHGICATLLPDRVTLDEWGYPIVEPGADPEAADADLAIRYCPARALYQQVRVA